MGETSDTVVRMDPPQPPDVCLEDLGPDGVMQSCEYDGGEWAVTYEEMGPLDPGLGDPGFGAVSTGIPPAFLAFMVVIFVLGVATALYRVSLARRMAVESGMDPDRATAMTMLTDDGLEATYLASSLRRPAPQVGQTPEPAAAPRSVEERLQELQRLRDQGLVTYEEYDARRQAIIDSL
ncbi:MAG TPA: SHOCT domain-containing protein [Nocardioidaceae bacterium]